MDKIGRRSSSSSRNNVIRRDHGMIHKNEGFRMLTSCMWRDVLPTAIIIFLNFTMYVIAHDSILYRDDLSVLYDDCLPGSDQSLQLRRWIECCTH